MKKMLVAMLIVSTIFTSIPVSFNPMVVKAEEVESMTEEVMEEKTIEETTEESETVSAEEMAEQETESEQEDVVSDVTEEVTEETSTEMTEDNDIDSDMEVVKESTVSVTLNETETYMAAGTEKELTATITGNEDNLDAIWTSSNESVATVKDGKVKALKKGAAVITVTVGDVSTTETVTVEEVSLCKTTETVTVGKTTSLSVSGTTQSITWESKDTSIATVDSNGAVKGVKAGKAIITATVDGTVLECEVTVSVAPSVTLNKSKIYLAEGCKTTLVATVKNTDEAVKWSSSDKNIAKVDKDGNVTAVKAGKAVITAKSGTASITCSVTVENPALSKTSMYLAKGVSTTLKVKGTKQAAKWSTSDKSIVTVDKNGTVKAVKKGSATVTAKVDGKKLKCKIKVEDPSISNKYVSLKKGKTAILSVSGTKQTIKWSSSDKSIAKVSKAGKVTAVANGKATITAKVDGKKLKCTVYVESLSMKESEYLAKGGSFKLKVKGAADTNGAKYATSDKSIATVDKNGKVTGKKTGTVTVTVKLHGQKLKCKIKVENPKISKTSITVAEKGTTTLKVKGASKKVTWSTSDKNIAKVDKNGKVTGVKKGTVTITAKVEHKNITCKVTVTKPEISKTSAKIYLGGTTNLKVTDTKSTVTWSTSDKSIATVNKNGKVTGKKEGTATITAKVDGKKLKCTVKIKKRVATQDDYDYIDYLMCMHFDPSLNGELTTEDFLKTLQKKYPEIDWYFRESNDIDAIGDEYLKLGERWGTAEELENDMFIHVWCALDVDGTDHGGYVYGLYRK